MNFCVGTEGITVLSPNDIRAPPNNLFLHVHCKIIYPINQHSRKFLFKSIQISNFRGPPARGICDPVKCTLVPMLDAKTDHGNVTRAFS